MQLSASMTGQRLIVRAVADGATGARLRAVGFRPGTVVDVGRRAPLGDPTIYRVRGSQFALRRDTAALVEVDDLAEQPAAPPSGSRTDG